ncbi:minor tail protein [Mycobacterium phage MOOREtheMARYer]|uniref:Minor tail protein n=1 Tax=Mycobacterium phage MOOREtheMARYer TaxID=1647309 RepID=A0A0F6YQH9_9CAUD|nr:minor tail protein [Mycobacterium phage MOOREtheMARYer]AKF14883.1 hypothetical protein SEA_MOORETHEMARYER_22 [Mycobacterium phage MOOREtheMARYer]
MAFEKRYKTVVPIPVPAGTDRPYTTEDLEPGAREGHPDILTARWLGRESFENTAAGDRLELVEYHERIIPTDEVDPRLADVVGPIDKFVWFEFSGLGRLNEAAFDWFAAEFVWKCEEWLAAERTYAQQVDDWLAAEREHQADTGGA